MPHNKRYKEARKVTLIGAGSNALLGFIKLIGGIFFHSHALVADGVHSFSDLFADAMVLIASKYGSQGADDSHPYGHQRIETAATLLLSMFLILAGCGIAWDSLTEIIDKKATTPGFLAIPIALLSIVANEILFYYTRHIGNRINSQLIIANAWHHRSDSAASAVVLIGLIGSLLGFKLLDPLAAIIVGGMVIKMGLHYAWNSVKELVDTGVEATEVTRIENIIRNVDGVQKIHQLRNRMMGKDIFVDVHILVSPYISVSEGHYIAQNVHQSLMHKLTAIKDVTVHVDPEDDECVSPSEGLPNRSLVESTLLKPWKNDFPSIESWVVHYLNGEIQVDIYIPKSFKQLIDLEQRIEQDLSKQTTVKAVNLFVSQKCLFTTF